MEYIAGEGRFITEELRTLMAKNYKALPFGEGSDALLLTDDTPSGSRHLAAVLTDISHMSHHFLSVGDGVAVRKSWNARYTSACHEDNQFVLTSTFWSDPFQLYIVRCTFLI